MNIRRAVHRVLRSFGLRLTRVEGAVDDMLEIGTELKAMAANLSTTAERLERAVAEQGRTLSQQLDTIHDERQRRAGIGQQVMELDSRVSRLELGRVATNGAAE